MNAKGGSGRSEDHVAVCKPQVVMLHQQRWRANIPSLLFSTVVLPPLLLFMPESIVQRIVPGAPPPPTHQKAQRKKRRAKGGDDDDAKDPIAPELLDVPQPTPDGSAIPDSDAKPSFTLDLLSKRKRLATKKIVCYLACSRFCCCLIFFWPESVLCLRHHRPRKTRRRSETHHQTASRT